MQQFNITAIYVVKFVPAEGSASVIIQGLTAGSELIMLPHLCINCMCVHAHFSADKHANEDMDIL